MITFHFSYLCIVTLLKIISGIVGLIVSFFAIRFYMIGTTYYKTKAKEKAPSESPNKR